MSRTSVIIPYFRGYEWLPRCIAALRQAGPDEILLVDDASPDEGVAWLRAHAPDVRVIRHEASRGFAAACNSGLRAATGELLFLLNQDTEVEPGWLAALVAALSDPTVGLAGSRATYPDGRLQHAGGWINAHGEGRHYHEERPAGEVDYVTGASVGLRREVYERLGGLDERFSPAYFEDVEWCLRARRHGLKVWYEPASRLIHHEQSQLAGTAPEQMLPFHRNRIRLVLLYWGEAALRERFLPAERAWLDSLGPGGERLIAAMHRIYLHFLMRLDEVASEGGAPPATKARVLVELLATLPAGPMALGGEPEPPPAADDPAPASVEAPPPSEAVSGARSLLARWEGRRIQWPPLRWLLDHLRLSESVRRLAAQERRSDAMQRQLAAQERRSDEMQQRADSLALQLAQARESQRRTQEVLLAYLQATNHNLGEVGRTLFPPRSDGPDEPSGG